MENSSRVAAILIEKQTESKRVSSEIDRLSAELINAKRSLEILDAQIQVLHEAMGDDRPLPSTDAAPVPSRHRVRINPARFRRSGWRDVLTEVSHRFAGSFTIDDVVDVATSMGTELPRSTIRSQAANFVDAGRLKRVEQGVFEFTDLGRAEFGNAKNSSIAPTPVTQVLSHAPSSGSGLFGIEYPDRNE